MKTLLLLLILALSAFSQDLPKDFTFDKKGDGTEATYQMSPSDEKMLSDAELGNAFSALGTISQPEQDKFALVFINAQKDFQFEQQQDKPFVLLFGSGSDEKITGSHATVFKRNKVKKLKVEMLMVQITRADFERLQSAENILVSYGDIIYNVPFVNLQAFRYVKSKIDFDVAQRERRRTPAALPPVNSGGEVQAKGYYRKDGTYVRPHTRRKKG